MRAHAATPKSDQNTCGTNWSLSYKFIQYIIDSIRFYDWILLDYTHEMPHRLFKRAHTVATKHPCLPGPVEAVYRPEAPPQKVEIIFCGQTDIFVIMPFQMHQHTDADIRTYTHTHLHALSLTHLHTYKPRRTHTHTCTFTLAHKHICTRYAIRT